MPERRPRAAVIGSGFGGLAAAIRLQAMGADVVVFESRDKPGGRAYVYEQDGFVFDAGPTVITAPHVFEELFALAGEPLSRSVELMPVTPFYRLLWDDGVQMDYAGDPAAMLAAIRALAPDDVEGYLRFAAYSKQVFERGYVDLVAQPFLRFSDMLRVAPSLARLRADRSVYRTVARFVRDPHLREALSFHALLVGGNPFDTSAIYTLIHWLEREYGVWFPRGGTGALVRALATLLVDLGGELRLSCPATRIEVEGRSHLVTSPKRERERFDLVVSNADVHHTYARLYGEDPRAAPMRERLERADWSMSLFVLYFGTDRPYRDVAHHTVLFGPRYEGLLREIFDGPSLPSEHSLYLHAPHVSDPSLAPAGCGAFYVLSPVPHLGKANVDWEREAPRYADRVLATLEKVLPDVRRHVVVQRWMTPRDFESELGAYQGSAFSIAPRLLQSAWFRPHNRDDRIPNLYIVGAGTHPGAGLPGVVSSAKATARLVAEDFSLDFDRVSPRRARPVRTAAVQEAP